MLPGCTRALFSDQQNDSPHPVLGPSTPHATVSAPPSHPVRTVRVHGVLADMENLKKVLSTEIEEFREQGYRFLNKEISVMDFKHISGGMGAYAHRGGKEFMLRLRIPSGIITIEQLKLICDWIEKYKLGGIHFTTRQAIQYHGLTIDGICDLMQDALKNIQQIIICVHAGTGGPKNSEFSTCYRNLICLTLVLQQPDFWTILQIGTS